ncbi:hypothetical protein F2P79_005888 [Pimephales promelas]|nr:hypothetical protein F2P79_005888 [Pimephales promelas]
MILIYPRRLRERILHYQHRGDQGFKWTEEHACVYPVERLMMLNAVIKGFEAFVVEQDLQGKMMAVFLWEKKFWGFYSNIKI